jgi:hypothetical protein
MELRLRLDMLAQPDDSTCGPTCLQAIYTYYGDHIPLPDLVQQIPSLEAGGTLAVNLACHALRRGYRATIYTYNLTLFDPTWFLPGAPDIADRLRAQSTVKRSSKFQVATAAYLEFLALGGELRFEDLTGALLRRYLGRGFPILTGLSATYLYRSARERGTSMDYDDIAGEPSGHFVVLCGYDRQERSVLVADPLLPNPFAATNQYLVNRNRLLCSILLGILTYDDNLLVIRPKAESAP